VSRTVEELAADLSSPDAIVRDQALGMLVSYGHRATAALLPLLDSDDRALRALASRALAHIADPATADRLARLLDDPVAQVRAQSAWGLHRMHDPRALDALLKTINDWPHATRVDRTLATDALIAIGEPALARVAELLAAPSSETRGRARLVILTVADHLPPAAAARWRARVAPGAK
jgi:HEAT repeat protein